MTALAQEPAQRSVDLELAIATAPSELGRVITAHGLGGLAHSHAKHLADRFPALIAELDTARKEAWMQHLAITTDLRTVAEVLNGAAVPWAVIKGPVLAERAYGGPDRRRYLDLDVLVHPAAFGDALAALAAAGLELVDCNWPLIRATTRGELTLVVNRRTVLDLHWHLLNDKKLRADAVWDMPALLARTEMAAIAGIDVPVLHPVDAVVHLCVHACLSGGHRLLWLKDIERQLAAFPVPLGVLEREARQIGLWPQVSLAILRAARTFHLDEPRHRPAWTRLVVALGHDRFGTDKRPAGRSVAMSTRSTPIRSVRALVVNRARHKVSRLPRWARRGLLADQPTYEVLRSPAGGAVERAQYLAEVTASAGRPAPGARR